MKPCDAGTWYNVGAAWDVALRPIHLWVLGSDPTPQLCPERAFEIVVQAFRSPMAAHSIVRLILWLVLLLGCTRPVCLDSSALHHARVHQLPVEPIPYDRGPSSPTSVFLLVKVEASRQTWRNLRLVASHSPVCISSQDCLLSEHRPPRPYVVCRKTHHLRLFASFLIII